MEREKKTALIVFAITVVLTTISTLCLPETVRVMHTVRTDTITYLPKIYAIGLAAILCIIGPIGVLLSKQEDEKKYRILTSSVMGIMLFIYMILANSFKF